MRQLRVVLITNAFLPHAGGSRLLYYHLFKQIAAPDCEVTIVTGKVPGWRAFDAREQTRSFRIKRYFKPLLDHSYFQLPKMIGPVAAGALTSLFRRADVVCCGDLFPAGLTGLALKKAFGFPLVTFCHGEDVTLTDQRRFQPKVRDRIFSAADAIIANGGFAVENLRRIGVHDLKVHKITPGVDTSAFFPDAPDDALRRRHGIREELVILTVARLVPRKGHRYVMSALAALASEIPPFKYLIVGQGSEEAALRSLAETLKLQDKVVFAGFVPGHDLNNHYNLADVVVMPNISEAGDLEGFGMVFLEANAAGKPVIGGRSGGTAEAVVDGRTGILVDPEQGGQLADALRLLLTDAASRRNMGEAGLHRVGSEFGWDTRARTFRRILDDVVTNHSG
jgi:phosphatidylinositol alpha-1,6-mannosyltransferase